MATRTRNKEAKKARQYVVDEKGHRTGVILTPEEFEAQLRAEDRLP